MAGTDCFFTVKREQLTLGRILLRAAQRRAWALGLRLRYKWEGDSFYVSLDGPLPLMQAFSRAITRDLPAVSEGFPATPGNVRREVATRLVKELSAAVRRSESHIADVSTWLKGTPVSHRFDPGSRTHLVGHLTDFGQFLHLHMIGEVEPRHILEEAHTVVEMLLKEVLVDRGAGESFEGMARQAHIEGLLGSDELAVLIALKDHRKKGKHRGQGVSASVADELVFPIVKVCQMLLAVVRGEARQAKGS